MTTMLETSIRQELDRAATTQPFTVAEVRSQIVHWDIAPARRQKLRTALSIAARALAPSQPRAVAYAQVRVDCDSFRRLRQAPSATFRISKERMTSLLSELVAILRQLSLHEPNTRRTPIVSCSLQALYGALPERQQFGLVDFFRYLDRADVSPDAVTSATLIAYGTFKRDRTLCRDIDKRVKQVARAWNKARDHVQGWPVVSLAAGSDRVKEKLALPLAAFPVSFQEDVRRYTERLSGQDVAAVFSEEVFGEDDPNGDRRLRLLRPCSIKGRVGHIRRAATALTIKGNPIDEIRSLLDLVSPSAHPRAILEFELGRNGGKTRVQTEQLADSIRLIARDYCRLPTAEVRQIATWAKRVRMPKRKSMTEKNRRRLRALMANRVRAMLLHLPAHLMKEAAEMGASHGKAAARLAMYAVAIEILLICPMRIANLAALRIDRHLHRPDPRKSLITHILVDADEVKNEQELEWPVPRETSQLINTYLTKYRPLLTKPGNPFLFPTPGEDGRIAQSIATWLSGAVARYIGVEFNAHLVRHFSAWNFLRKNPGQYESVRRILGHRTIDTTIRYYVWLEVEAEAKRFDTMVLQDRQATRRIALQAFRAGRGGLAPQGPENRP